MSYTPYSRVTYTSNGTDSEFVIPFPYLYEATLHVYRGSFRQFYPQDYVIDRQARRIVFPEPLPVGMPLQIKRVTPRRTEERPVVFTNGSGLDDVLLNTAELYLLFVLQELLDDVAAGINVNTEIGGGVSFGELNSAIDEVFDEIRSQHELDLAALQAAVDAINVKIADTLANLPIGAAVTEVITTELSPGGAIATKIAQVSARVDDEASARAAAIHTEETARVTATDATATRLDIIAAQLSTETTNRIAAIASEATTRVTADTATADYVALVEAALTNLGISLGASITSETLARVTADEATALTISNVQAKIDDPVTGLTKSHARITEESSARATQGTAFADTIQTLTGRVGNAESSVVNEQTARTNADSALAGRLTTIESAVNAPSGTVDARISALDSTQATRLAAMAQTIVKLAASMVDQASGVEQSAARIEQVNTTSVNAIKAVADRTTNVEASINLLSPGGDLTSILGRITSAENAASSAVGAAAATNTTLTTTYSTTAVAQQDAQNRANAARDAAILDAAGKDVVVAATVTAEANARSNANQASASTLTKLMAAMGGDAAAVQIIAEAIIDAAGKIVTKWNLSLQAGDTITGIEAMAQNGPNPVSKVKILANVFEIASVLNGSSVVPFEVVNGVTKIKTALIQDASIGTLMLAGNAVTVPCVANIGGYVDGNSTWRRLGDTSFYMPQPGVAAITAKHTIGYAAGKVYRQSRLMVDEVQVDYEQGGSVLDIITLMAGVQLAAGWHKIAIDYNGTSNTSAYNGRIVSTTAMK